MAKEIHYGNKPDPKPQRKPPSARVRAVVNSCGVQQSAEGSRVSLSCNGKRRVYGREARCPLCDHGEVGPSWNGTVVFQGHEFEYVECERCQSLFCYPMPGSEVLRVMYGPQYSKSFDNGDGAENPREPARVIEVLREREGGTFVDYGCGGGELLSEASGLGWTVLGVEFDKEAARATAQRTRLRVVQRDDEFVKQCRADIVHLGDVIEHLVNIDGEMERVLRILKPGGILIAQGPLEASPNLFTWILRLKKLASRQTTTQMAPYHVILATAEGQRAMFRRFGIDEEQYLIREVSWPAPAKLRPSVLSKPRLLTLYLLRRLSQGISRLRPNRLGNRYFYVGRWGGSGG